MNNKFQRISKNFYKFLVILVMVVGVLIWSKSDRQNLQSSNVLKSVSGVGVITGEKPKTQITQNPNQARDFKEFSIEIPEDLRVSEAEEQEGRIILVEDLANKGSGFQIFITSFDEPGPITPERIKKDVPNMVINDPKWAELDGVKTIVFYGRDESIGETFEVWPVYKEQLYQIMSPKGAEKILVEVLETWRFK